MPSIRLPRQMALAGVIAAVYAALTLLLPIPQYGPVQFRVAEAMTLLPFLCPAAIPGLTLGCLLYNVSWSQSLPLDWLVGSLATCLATACMWGLRKVKIAKCPFLALLMPAVWNAPLVGWELAVYLGESGFTWPVFGLNALYVFLGEAIVLLVLGTLLYYALTARKLDQRLFSAKN